MWPYNKTSEVLFFIQESVDMLGSSAIIFSRDSSDIHEYTLFKISI